MKQLLLHVFLLILLAINATAQESITAIKGKVHFWPTDTIYLQTMPFHSPHLSELKHQIVSKDSTFSFEFKNIDKPFVVQLFMSEQNAKLNKEHLLYNNLTDQYFYNQCEKFYTYGTTTFLLEPNRTLNIELERNWSISKLTPQMAKKYRETGVEVSKDNTLEATQKTSISFLGENTFQNEYFQKSFSLDNKIDNRLDIYKTLPIDKAIISLKKIRRNFLDELEKNKNKLSPTFYNYIYAEIEFSIKKEFLRFLMLTKEKEMNVFYTNEIPQEIMDIIEFDNENINIETLISESYNKFLPLYLNFKLNIKNKSYQRYYEYDINKIRTAIKNFPEKSVYYFITNYLLQPQTNRKEMIKTIKNEEAVEELILKTILKYPNGELNDKLIEKYNL
ncbi:hypothetical protein [Snuella lapsa]|uniref:DUF4369 domain-containing protein n=1 Tax=Snuella lapsa TaxID=870481 RepID=A0ABP6WYC8_9FLAO